MPLKKFTRTNQWVKIKIDAGAGTGLVGIELKKLGYTNLYVLDISTEMLREAKKKEVYTEFICTSLNGQSIPQIKSGQFDALTCGGALITGRIGSSAFVEMIRMVKTGRCFSGVYRGTDVFDLPMSAGSLFCD